MISDAAAKTLAYETGQFWNPDFPDGANVARADLDSLDVKERTATDAFRSLSFMMPREYAAAVAKHHHRAPDFDGELGPAMRELLEMPRCRVPDYAPPPGITFNFDDPDLQQVAQRMQDDYHLPAVGPGNWPRCHNIGEFHCAVVRINLSTKPSWFSDSLLVQVLTKVQRAYDGVGLHLIFIDTNFKDLLTGENRGGEHVDIESSWQQLSGGAIGLAIVGRGINCRQNIWQRYDPDYRGGSSMESILAQQVSLWAHETGHNTGLGHVNGWVMNPSIVNGLPDPWDPRDPSRSTLETRYGGVKYVPPGGNPPPDPDPDPPTDLEKRLAALERQAYQNNIKDAVQDVRITLIEKRLP